MNTETKTAHSPGPWHWEQKGDCHDLQNDAGVVIHSDGSACGEYGPDIDVKGPDARLIAAAPDLLAALKGLIQMCEAGYDPHEQPALLLPAKAAISKAEAKAEGGAQ